MLPILAFLLIGCSSDDIDVGTETESQSTGFISVGNPIEVTLNLTTLPFDVDVSTRTEDPREYEPSYPNELDAIERENNIKTVWIFEFDQETGDLVCDPFYTTCDGYNTDNTRNLRYWPAYDVPLSDNNGEPVIIYAIANADGKDQSNAVKNWVAYDEETGTYPGFMNIKDLEAQTLPTTYQYMKTCTTSTTWPVYYVTSSRYSSEYIPMSGYTENLILTSSQRINVDVSSMYARIMVYASTDNPDVFVYNDDHMEWNYNIVIENIPCYCTVGPLADEKTTTAHDYTSITGLRWTYFSIVTVGSNTFQIIPEYEDTSKDTRLIAYVPENIQGEVSQYDSEKMRAENAPQTQYTSETKTYDNLSYPDYGLSGVSSATDAMAVHFYQQAEKKTWTIFPGGNNTDNFNVRRNCTYRIIFNLVEQTAEDVDVDLTITNGDNESFFTNDDSFSYKYRK